MRIGKIASGAEYRIGEEFQNLPTFGFSIVFQIERILFCFVLSIFAILKFQKIGRSTFYQFKILTPTHLLVF